MSSPLKLDFDLNSASFALESCMNAALQYLHSLKAQDESFVKNIFLGLWSADRDS
jgi:hypothetical protein